jgi:hypothetical protein
METPDLMLAPDQESLATLHDILMQLRRRDGERAEETHALVEQLERIKWELMRLSAFVRQNNSTGFRSFGGQVVPVANLDEPEPPGESTVIWPTPPAGTETGGVESADGILIALEAVTGASEASGSEGLGDGGQRTHVSFPPLAPTLESWSRPTPPPNTPTSVFASASSGRGTESSSIWANLPPPSFLSVPDGSPPMLAQVTNTQLMGSLSDLHRTMDRFIRRQQITNDMLEDLRGRIPVQQMQGLGVSELTNYTQVLSHIYQSLRTVADQLRTSSGNEPVEVSAPSRSPISFDVQTDATVSQATLKEGSTPSSPLPEPPSIHLARLLPLTSPPSASGAAPPRTHAPNETSQQPSIWQPRARRVVPRRRVFSEPSSSASQKTGGLRELREREREQAPSDSGTSTIASRRPSILRSQSPDRRPLSGAQCKTPNKPNVLTGVRPMVCCIQLRVCLRKCLNAAQYQRSVSAPVAYEGVSVKSKPKRRSVAWASPVVSVRPWQIFIPAGLNIHCEGFQYL